MPRYYRLLWGEHPYTADIIIREGEPGFDAIDAVVNPPRKPNPTEVQLKMFGEDKEKKKCPICRNKIIVTDKGIILIHWKIGIKCRTSGTLYDRWLPDLHANEEKEKGNG